jgi:hypothetical protein
MPAAGSGKCASRARTRVSITKAPPALSPATKIWFEESTLPTSLNLVSTYKVEIELGIGGREIDRWTVDW